MTDINTDMFILSLFLHLDLFYNIIYTTYAGYFVTQSLDYLTMTIK